MKNVYTKVTDLSKKQALANLTPDPRMPLGKWVKQTAKRIGVTPNTVYRSLGVKA